MDFDSLEEIARLKQRSNILFLGHLSCGILSYVDSVRLTLRLQFKLFLVVGSLPPDCGSLDPKRPALLKTPHQPFTFRALKMKACMKREDPLG